jgi:hypothetical protein
MDVDEFIEWTKEVFAEDCIGITPTYDYESWEKYPNKYTIEEAIRRVFDDMELITDIEPWLEYSNSVESLPEFTGYQTIDIWCGPSNLANVLHHLSVTIDRNEFTNKWRTIFEEWNKIAFEAYLKSNLKDHVKMYSVTYADDGGQGDMEHGEHWKYLNPVIINNH